VHPEQDSRRLQQEVPKNDRRGRGMTPSRRVHRDGGKCCPGDESRGCWRRGRLTRDRLRRG
jgi:hypothetical protein